MTCVYFPTKNPLGKPLKIQKSMTDLNELISFLPDDWEEDSLKVKASHPVLGKMLKEILIEAIKTAPVLISDLGAERLKTDGLFRELNHVKERKQEAYTDGISDALTRLVDAEVRTPTARDALLEAAARVQDLLDKSKNHT